MRATAFALFAFGVLISAAALSYPGGTWESRHTVGYSFWNNFWCDLLGTVALNGQDNVRGSLLSRLAFGCFALALYRFWPHAAELAGGLPSARRAARLGQVGGIGLLTVALVPSTTSQLVHGIAVVASAGCSVVAASMLLRGLARAGERVGAALGLLVTASAVLCLAQYVYQGLFAHEAATWLAGMQKVTTVFLLAFMVRLMFRPARVPAPVHVPLPST